MPKSKRKPSKDGSRSTAGQLRSVRTDNLPGLLEQLGVSLAVSTYQASKVILVRNDGGKLNTHFRDYEKPMGLAGDGQCPGRARRAGGGDAAGNRGGPWV